MEDLPVQGQGNQNCSTDRRDGHRAPLLAEYLLAVDGCRGGQSSPGMLLWVGFHVPVDGPILMHV